MRQEFPAKVKIAAFERANGRCERCTAKVGVGNVEYDHGIPCGLGGAASDANCIVLCKTCHRSKTSKDDVPRIAKAKRQQRYAAGIKKPRTITRWKRFGGTIVYADRQR